ncbi:ESX secretion-associated protein EspG [Mycobacterium sp. CVI_P3]|uniref:ESX secretion-associated protein EspG n=1 Tax=Mycobacterium pinniadriaticum TaxID=2994102 RepID=A0ABT3SJZ5_9MYCO|nr:ESX secretion-associated protein EspG [Mycobacterium pinniadriaticum]MCX2933418.1 ESX secretion-associated protein EspG [Mycobacterium pinniadriaticum]MCX2939840.1 ESX secretion-associated protein EspG [Mycobacterium pinniadriaticum]
MPAADAVELSVEAAWFIAEEGEVGTFPWVLAITPPCCDVSERAAFASRQVAELTRLGLVAHGRIDPAVRQWIRVVCWPERWLELRYVDGAGSSADRLRGIVAYRQGQIVVALRNAQLVTFTALNIASGQAMSPIVTAALPGRAAARFEEFTLPLRVGARADEQLREGAELSDVMRHLGIPESARAVVRATFDQPTTYVEVLAGQLDGATPMTTEIGIAVLDSAAGRLVVSPVRAFDGEWVSVFAPGTDLAIALAIERLTDVLPAGPWFSPLQPVRDFIAQDS